MEREGIGGNRIGIWKREGLGGSRIGRWKGRGWGSRIGRWKRRAWRGVGLVDEKGGEGEIWYIDVKEKR